MLCFPQINLVFQTQLLSQLFSCAFLSSNHLVFFFEPNYFPNPTFFIFLLSSKSTCFQTQLFSQPFFLSAFCSSESQCYIHTKNICYVCICMHIHSKYDIWLILQAWTRKTYVKYPAGGASCWRTSSRTWRETILAYTCKLPWNLVQGAKTCPQQSPKLFPEPLGNLPGTCVPLPLEPAHNSFRPFVEMYTCKIIGLLHMEIWRKRNKKLTAGLNTALFLCHRACGLEHRWLGHNFQSAVLMQGSFPSLR